MSCKEKRILDFLLTGTSWRMKSCSFRDFDLSFLARGNLEAMVRGIVKPLAGDYPRTWRWTTRMKTGATQDGTT